MYRFYTYKQQYKANLKLALPVVLTQLGQIFVQVAANKYQQEHKHCITCR